MITHTRLALGYGLAIDFHAIRLQLRGVVGSHWTAAKGACQGLLQGPRPPTCQPSDDDSATFTRLTKIPYLPKVLSDMHLIRYLTFPQGTFVCTAVNSPHERCTARTAPLYTVYRTVPTVPLDNHTRTRWTPASKHQIQCHNSIRSHAWRNL